jgi:hypothetical protein
MAENSSEELLRLHVAGATVRHAGPFSDLEVPCSWNRLDRAFLETWVVPFYMAFMGGRSPLGEQLEHLKRIWSSIDQEIVARLLEDFDWRPRTVGPTSRSSNGWITSGTKIEQFIDAMSDVEKLRAVLSAPTDI